MANVAARASKNVRSIKFEIKVDNIERLDTYYSETVYVRGLPWAVELTRLELDTGEDSLAIALSSKYQNIRDDWDIIAEPSLKIITSNETENWKYFGRVPFNANNLWWMEKSFFLWKDLIDPHNGYVKNGACKFEVKIEAGPLQNSSTNEWMKLDIFKLCDNCSKGKFRLTVFKFDEFFGVISSPLTLGNNSWRIFLRKGAKLTKHNESSSVEKYLQIDLHHELPEDELPYKVTMCCKLIPFSPSAESVVLKIVRHVEPDFETDEVNFIPWSTLIDPQNRFIENNSFVVEIDLSIDPEQVIGCDGGGTKKLECPICFECLIDQHLSSPRCGHVFCTPCIQRSVQQNPVCPTCKKATTFGDLNPIYLSFK